MRDLGVFLLFVGVLPLSFLRPWLGVCAFTWLAYNRTQDLTWGFARTLPLSQFIAIAMILGWVVFEFRPLPLRTWRLKAVVVLVLWVSLSLALNTVRWGAQGSRYADFVKVIFVALLSGALLTNRARLRQLLAVMSLALGFYGCKNGLLYVLGGSKSITGPGGMLKDNNDFALAMVMNIPLLWYLADEMRALPYGRWIRLFMRFTVFASLLTIISTGSRGAFLSLACGVLLMALKARYKAAALAGLFLAGVLGLAFAPAEYKERIATIFDPAEEQDESVQGRLTSWLVALNMIKANPGLGIGFNNMVYEYNRYTEGIYNEQGTTQHFARVAHNSYLQIWAESGTPAFLCFMAALLGTVVYLEVLWRRSRREGQTWVVDYCHAIQVSLCCYLVGATFLNRAHFDFMYQLVVIAAVLPGIVAHEQFHTRRRRAGPQLAHDIRVRSPDPFVRVPES